MARTYICILYMWIGIYIPFQIYSTNDITLAWSGSSATACAALGAFGGTALGNYLIRCAWKDRDARHKSMQRSCNAMQHIDRIVPRARSTVLRARTQPAFLYPDEKGCVDFQAWSNTWKYRAQQARRFLQGVHQQLGLCVIDVLDQIERDNDVVQLGVIMQQLDNIIRPHLDAHKLTGEIVHALPRIAHLQRCASKVKESICCNPKIDPCTKLGIENRYLTMNNLAHLERLHINTYNAAIRNLHQISHVQQDLQESRTYHKQLRDWIEGYEAQLQEVESSHEAIAQVSWKAQYHLQRVQEQTRAAWWDTYLPYITACTGVFVGIGAYAVSALLGVS